MSQCICEHPNFIVNPLAGELIAEHCNYVIRGKQFKLSNCKSLLYDFKTKNINPHSLRITHDDIDTCYIVDSVSSEHYPLYLEVPCGHCEVCKSAKVNAFVHRCKLETMCYDCKPIFLTLTYDELHKKECGVSLRDCQLFLKRLRINLYRRGYREKIRYVLVSEYGKPPKRLKSGRYTLGYRPHYHAILWNVHQSDILSYREITDTIKRSWSNGFVMSRFIDPSNDKCFYYTSKYLSKGSNAPNQNYAKTFCVSSNRGGAIGAGFIDRHAKGILRCSQCSYKFRNKFSGKVENLQFNRYVLNRALPSFSRSLGSGVKKHVRQFILDYNILKSRNNENQKAFEKTFNELSSFFGKFFYCPILSPSEVKSSMEVPTASLLRSLLEAEIVIRRAIGKGHKYYERAKYLHECRKSFLVKMFEHQDDIDLQHRSYEFRRMTELAAQREIL